MNILLRWVLIKSDKAVGSKGETTWRKEGIPVGSLTPYRRTQFSIEKVLDQDPDADAAQEVYKLGDNWLPGIRIESKTAKP